MRALRSSRAAARLPARASAPASPPASPLKASGRAFFAAPAATPPAPPFRHPDRCELYSPSRRSRRPISPGVSQASAFSMTDSLYAAVKRRLVTPSRHLRIRRGCRASLALPEERGVPFVFIPSPRPILQLSASPYSKHFLPSCLAHVGREGHVRIRRCTAVWFPLTWSLIPFSGLREWRPTPEFRFTVRPRQAPKRRAIPVNSTGRSALGHDDLAGLGRTQSAERRAHRGSARHQAAREVGPHRPATRSSSIACSSWRPSTWQGSIRATALPWCVMSTAPCPTSLSNPLSPFFASLTDARLILAIVALRVLPVKRLAPRRAQGGVGGVS